MFSVIRWENKRNHLLSFCLGIKNDPKWVEEWQQNSYRSAFQQLYICCVRMSEQSDRWLRDFTKSEVLFLDVYSVRPAVEILKATVE